MRGRYFIAALALAVILMSLGGTVLAQSGPSGWFDIQSNLRVWQDVDIWDDLTVGDDVSVVGAITAEDLTLTDDLVVGDDVTVGGALTVTGAISAADFLAIAADSLSIADDMTLGGNATIDGYLTSLGAPVTLITKTQTITPSVEGVYVVASGGAAAELSIVETASSDGMRITVVSLEATAHKVIAPTKGFNAGNAGTDTCTFSTAIGNSIEVIMYEGEWYILNSTGCTLG